MIKTSTDLHFAHTKWLLMHRHGVHWSGYMQLSVIFVALTRSVKSAGLKYNLFEVHMFFSLVLFCT